MGGSLPKHLKNKNIFPIYETEKHKKQALSGIELPCMRVWYKKNNLILNFLYFFLLEAWNTEKLRNITKITRTELEKEKQAK